MNEPKKILLIIEDNPLLTGMYQVAFEKAGFEVLVAHEGDAGLKLAEEKKPDIVTLDLLMPGMSGFEVLEKLKAGDSTKNIKVAVLTALADKEHKEKATRLGADDYLIKSDLTLAQIVDTIKSI